MLTWIDVETTGLDPKSEHMLELAVVVTNDRLDVVAQMNQVIRFNGFISNDYVRKIHTDNGLLNECTTAPSLADAEEKFLRVINDYQLAETYLCGSTVSFDREFLRRWMPKAEALFNYRNVDVSSFTKIAELWVPQVAELVAPYRDKEKSEHRAMSDILNSIEIMKIFKDSWLFQSDNG